MKTKIITHRGLDPDRSPYFRESSTEAFQDHLKRGFGLEFDVQFTKDGRMVVIHDSNLKRISGGSDERKVSDIPSWEILTMDFGKDHLGTLETVIDMIRRKSFQGSISALHVKAGSQTPEKLDKIIDAFRDTDPASLIFFDLTIEAAKYVRSKNRNIQMAASVSHPYDIERYNGVVGGTLITIEELLANKDLFSWAWLDEWDLADKNGAKKSLYNAETFKKLREEGIQIALVTPELHGTSPGLLGGEAHEDASSPERLNRRLAEIIALGPDAVCTDHPDYISDLLS